MSTTALLLLSLIAVDASPRGIVYDFSSIRCGPCQQMSPLVSQLEREGLPIQKVDVDENRGLAQQYGINSIPAFVLVIDGRVVDHKVGITSEATLRQMIARIPPAKPKQEQQREVRVKNPLKVAGGESKPALAAGKSIFQLPAIPALFRKQREVSIDEPFAANTDDAVIRANIDTKTDPPVKTRPVGPLASSTRIRVKDKDGINFGSGTVIDSREGRTIILTCGHIFRDLKKDSTIEVDLFDGDRTEPYVGTLIDFDADADVGLIAIPTATEIPAAKLAASASGVRKGDSVSSVGCGGGDPPTIQKQQVTALNRYLGPSNIECTGVPIQGRSGGGLFNSAGEIVGVCIAADQKEHRGIYAGLECVNDLLKQAKLTQLVAGEPSKETETHESPEEKPSADRADLLAVTEAQHRKGENRSGTEKGSKEPATEDEFADFPPRQSTQPRSSEGAEQGKGVSGETTGGDIGEAEVICIIRPLGKPNAASRVVVINRASTKFVSYLNGEVRRQPQQTMGSISFNPRETRSTQADRVRAISEELLGRDAETEVVEPRTAHRLSPRDTRQRHYHRENDRRDSDAVPSITADSTRDSKAILALSHITPHRYRRSPESR